MQDLYAKLDEYKKDGYGTEMSCKKIKDLGATMGKSAAQIIGMIGVIATAGATILRELIQLGQAGPAYFKSLMNIMELGTWDSIQWT